MKTYNHAEMIIFLPVFYKEMYNYEPSLDNPDFIVEYAYENGDIRYDGSHYWLSDERYYLLCK